LAAVLVTVAKGHRMFGLRHWPTVLAATKQLLEGEGPLARWRTTVFDDLEGVFLL
jgi:hypothetical protein